MIYQTSQNFIRIMNLQVIFYSVKVGFFSILSHNSRLLFQQPIVVYSILLNISGLNQSQQSEFSTYFVLSTDCKWNCDCDCWKLDGLPNREPHKRDMEEKRTRPDTRQSSRGQLGRRNNAKTARYSKM